jgi:hypothetical protein
VHLPVHASSLNQVEIYFSAIQRSVLTPKVIPSLSAVAQRLLDFQAYHRNITHPFEWSFTRQDLCKLLSKFQVEDPLEMAA